MVFDNFVFHNTHAGFLHGKFRQINPVLIGSFRCGIENSVYLLLGVGSVFRLGFAELIQAAGQAFCAVHGFVLHFGFLHIRSSCFQK